MAKFKNFLGYLVIIAVIAGIGYLAYYFIMHQENVIVFKAEGVENISGDLGEEVTLPVITKEGYDFLGWFYDKDLENACGDVIRLEKGTTTLYPSWSIKYYTVSIKHLYASVSTETVPYGHEFTLDNNIIPDFGYKIVWVNADTEEEVNGTIVVNNDLTFMQVNKPKTYTVNYYYDDLNETQVLRLTKELEYLNYNDLLYADETEADVEGHTLQSWYYFNSQNEKVTIGQSECLTEKIVRLADGNDTLNVYGEYSINSYQLVFKDSEDNRLQAVDLVYGSNVQTALDEVLASGNLDKAHNTIIGWKYAGENESSDFTNVTMPAIMLEVEPVYKLNEYSLQLVANLKNNLVPVTTLTYEYGNGLTIADIPTDEEIEEAINSYDGIVKYYEFSEFEFDYYSVNDEVEELDLSQILARFSLVEQDEMIIFNYIKDIFFIEYYSDSSLTTLVERREIDIKENFVIANGITHESQDYVFGGWAFANDPTMLLEYDSFDMVNIGEDVAVYADFYRNDPNRWETERIDGKLYLTKYKGGYENVVVPAQTQELIYGIGDGINSILNSGLANRVKRILVPETIKVINSKSFENVSVLVRFRNSSTQDTARYGLEIKKDAFISAPLATDESSYSISRIKLPTRTVTVEEGAFAGALDLEYIEVSENCENYADYDGVLYKKATQTDGRVLLAYPMAREDEDFVLDSDVVRIGDGAFMINSVDATYSLTDLPKLKTITVESDNSLREIGDKAFYGNVQFTTVSMPSLPNLTSVGDYTFYYCFDYGDRYATTYNTEFTFDFNNNISYVPAYFLANTKMLAKVTLLNTDMINTIQNDAFNGTGLYVRNYVEDNLKFTLKGDYNLIGDRSFMLTRLTIFIDSTFDLVEMNSLKPTIGNNAFSLSGNSAINTIYIKGVEGVTNVSISNANIGYRAFYGANSNLIFTFTDCDFGYSTTADYGLNFELSTFGGLNIVFDRLTENISISNKMLNNLTINGDITIEYKNNDGEIVGNALNNLICNALTLKGIASYANNAFGSSSVNATVSEVMYGPSIIVFDESCNLTSLGAESFFNCKNLTSVTLCSSINTIDGTTFATSKYVKATENSTPVKVVEALPNLISINIYNATTVLTVEGDTLVYETTNAKFFVPSAMLTAYQVTSPWSSVYFSGHLEGN